MSMLLSPNLPGGLGGLLGQATPGERLLTILQSRRVRLWWIALASRRLWGRKSGHGHRNLGWANGG